MTVAKPSARVSQPLGMTDETKILRYASFVDDVDEEYICALCLNVVVTPMICADSHMFCKGCIETALRAKGECPMDRRALCTADLRHVRVVENVVNKMRIRCPRAAGVQEGGVSGGQRGCDWVGQVGERAKHLDGACQLRPRTCPYESCGCAAGSMTAWELAVHEEKAAREHALLALRHATSVTKELQAAQEEVRNHQAMVGDLTERLHWVHTKVWRECGDDFAIPASGNDVSTPPPKKRRQNGNVPPTSKPTSAKNDSGEVAAAAKKKQPFWELCAAVEKKFSDDRKAKSDLVAAWLRAQDSTKKQPDASQSGDWREM